MLTYSRKLVNSHESTQNSTVIDSNMTRQARSIGKDDSFARFAIVGRRVILANTASLAGHIRVDDCAILGAFVAVHQFSRIGKHAFVGGLSGVSKDIPPYVLASGTPRAKLHGLNLVGLKRYGFGAEKIRALKRAYRILFRLGLTLNESIERVQAEVEQIPEIENLIEFIKTSERGITR